MGGGGEVSQQAVLCTRKLTLVYFKLEYWFLTGDNLVPQRTPGDIFVATARVCVCVCMRVC